MLHLLLLGFKATRHSTFILYCTLWCANASMC